MACFRNISKLLKVCARKTLKEGRRFIQNDIKSKNELVIIDVNEKSGFATLLLNRPPVNILNVEFLSALISALDEVQRDKVKGIILTSNVPNNFCAGLDIEVIGSADKNLIYPLVYATQDLFFQLYASPVPTAAAINGWSPAGGCFIATMCEYRAMVKNFTIGLNETQLGATVPRMLMIAMKNVISNRQTELAVTTGKLFTTEEAFNIGLIDEMVDSKEEAILKCEIFLQRFKNIPPEARAKSIQSFRRKDIEEVRRFRYEDADFFVESLFQPSIQDFIKSYLKNIKGN